MVSETSNFMRRNMMAQKTWKTSKRFPEFEVSNYGEVRKRGTRDCVKPTFDKHNNQWRVYLETVNGVSQVNLGNLVAECYIGDRPANKKVIFLNNKPEDISSYTAANVDYKSFKYPSTRTKSGIALDVAPLSDATPEQINTLAQAAAADGLEPQFIVLDVGSIAMTVSLEMAYGIAGIQGLDIYRLKKRGTGSMTVWVLGDKVE